MAETFTIRVTGLREAQNALYDYSQRLGDRVVLGALRLGANLVKREAQANAPVKTGKLQRGITVRRSKVHRGTMSDDLIGVYLTIPSRKKNDPFYGRFQEDGWRAGKAKRLIPGKKFMDRAFDEKGEEAVALIARSAISAADLLAIKLGL